MLVKEATKLSETMVTLHFDSWFMKVKNIIGVCVLPEPSQFIYTLDDRPEKSVGELTV